LTLALPGGALGVLRGAFTNFPCKLRLIFFRPGVQMTHCTPWLRLCDMLLLCIVSGVYLFQCTSPVLNLMVVTPRGRLSFLGPWRGGQHQVMGTG